MSEVLEEKRYSISEAAPLLDRSPHTLRSWDRKGSMPDELKPPRDTNGHRYWTDELIAKILEWIEENEFHPGSGIDYHPDGAQLAKHIIRIRRSTQARRSTQSPATPQETEFAERVREAVDPKGKLKISPDKIIAGIPAAVALYDELTLPDALRIAGQVLEQFR